MEREIENLKQVIRTLRDYIENTKISILEQEIKKREINILVIRGFVSKDKVEQEKAPFENIIVAEQKIQFELLKTIQFLGTAINHLEQAIEHEKGN